MQQKQIIWRQSLLGMMLLCFGLTAYAEGLVVIPDKEVIDLGSAPINTFGNQQKVEFRYATDGEYQISFEGDDRADFYTPSPFFYDTWSHSASAYVTFNPKSAGEKKIYIVARKGGAEVRRITVKGVGLSPSSPIIKVDYQQLPFGTIYIGSGMDLTARVSLSQSTATPTMEIRGKDKDEFKIFGTLRANQANQEVSIQFTPIREGDKDAEFVIRYGGIEQIVPIVAKGAYRPQYIYATPESLTFSEVHTNEQKQLSLELTLVQVNREPTYSFEGEGSEFFKVSKKTFEADAPSSHAVLTIDFCPERIGIFTPEFVIKTERQEKRIPIFAQVFEQAMPEIKLNPETVDFGTREIGSYHFREVTLTIENTSAVPLVSIEEDSSGAFGLLSKPKSGTSSFKIDFEPTVRGELHAKLVISVGSITKRFELKGISTGPDAVISADKSSLDFPDTPIKQKSAARGLNLRLKYLSKDVAVSVIGDHADEFLSSKQSLSRLAEDAYLEVVFAPKTVGAKRAILKLTTPDKEVEIPLSGNAVQESALCEVSQEPELSIQRKDGLLILTPRDGGGDLTIYSSEGLLLHHFASVATEVRLLLSSGVYLIHYNRISKKVIL